MNDEQLETSRLEEVYVSDGMMIAEIIKSRLESFSIPCMLKFEAIGRVMGLTADGLGKVQVMVPTDYADQAREVIETEALVEGDLPDDNQ